MGTKAIVVAGHLAILLAPASLAGCMATTTEMSERAAKASWRFQSDLESTSTCLMRAMNFEFQPKTTGETIFGRSINHSIAMAGRNTNHIVHEEIGAGTAWMFVVRSETPKITVAEAQISDLPIAEKAKEKMTNAAVSCKGSSIG